MQEQLVKLREAKLLYRNTNDTGKILLDNIFGAQAFVNPYQTYKDIKGYEDACDFLNEDPLNVPDFSMCSPGLAKYHLANFKAERFIRAVNFDGDKPFEPAYNDRRYIVWVDVRLDASHPSGFGLSFSDYGYGSSNASVAPRLTFRDENRARHTVQCINDILIDVYTFQK